MLFIVDMHLATHASFQAHHSNNLKQIIQIKHNGLKIETGRRQTSWLFTKRGGVKFGTTENKFSWWMNPGPPDYKSSALTTRPRSLPKGEESLKD